MIGSQDRQAIVIVAAMIHNARPDIAPESAAQQAVALWEAVEAATTNPE